MIGATWNRKGRKLVIANALAAVAVLLVVALLPGLYRVRPLAVNGNAARRRLF